MWGHPSKIHLFHILHYIVLSPRIGIQHVPALGVELEIICFHQASLIMGTAHTWKHRQGALLHICKSWGSWWWEWSGSHYEMHFTREDDKQWGHGAGNRAVSISSIVALTRSKPLDSRVSRVETRGSCLPVSFLKHPPSVCALESIAFCTLY